MKKSIENIKKTASTITHTDVIHEISGSTITHTGITKGKKASTITHGGKSDEKTASTITHTPIKKQKQSIETKEAVKRKSKSLPVKRSTVKRKRTATIMQQTAIKKVYKMVENGGNINLGKILIESGYSKKTAKTPGKVFGADIVQKAMVELSIDAKSMESVSKRLMNSRIVHSMRYSKKFDPKTIIDRYEKEIPGFRYLNYYSDGYDNVIEFTMPNDANQIRALEFMSKFIPMKPGDDGDMRKIASEKRTEKMKKLSEMAGLHLKNPIKLGIPDPESSSKN